MAFFSAAITLVVIVIALGSNGGGSLFALVGDLWSLLDVAFIFALGIGLLYKSRVAGVLLVAYFLVAKAFMMSELGFTSGSLFSLAFLYVFVRAAMATFAYRRIMCKKEPTYGSTTWVGYLLYSVGGLAGLLLIGLTLIGLFAPPVVVVTGEELQDRHRSVLTEEGILATGEEVVLFYSEGLFSVREGGAILTDQRVVSYEVIEEEVWIGSVSYEDILTVQIEEKGSLMTDTLILVTPKDGDPFYLFVAQEDGGDERMLQEIQQRMMAVE